MPSDQTPPELRRQHEHLGDRVDRLRILFLLGGPIFLILAAIELKLWMFHQISGWVFLLLLPLNLLVIGGVSRLVLAFSTGVGTGFVRTVYGAGDLAPDPGFSAEESMIIQGRLEAAEASLRQRLADHPEQHEAGLRLGALLVQMGRPEEAERVYLELRQHQLAPPVAMILANRLIDLYERGGRTDRLKVELGRFSGEWKGTGAGESAARRLREIKDAERQQDEPAAED